MKPASNPVNLDDLDPGVRPYVETLRANGIETIESCEGGDNHYSDRPWIRFRGESFTDGLKSVAIALDHAMPLFQLKRVWNVSEDNLVGPDWELSFFNKAEAKSICSD